jgi:MFS family permease
MASDLNEFGEPRPIASMASGVRFRLSVMMFLQFFIWGAWFELGFDYIPKLGFNGDWQLPLIFGAFNVGALVALFFSTQFADRKFAAEKFLAFSHLIGGLAIAGLAFLQAPLGTAQGNYNSVQITGQGDSETRGIGRMPDGTRVTVDGLSIKWPEFRENLAKFENETDPDKKKDPRPVVVFVVEESKNGELVGDAKTPLAPFWPFFLLMLIHSLFYVPTISITNSIAFANLRDPARQFGPVRVWGTIGWIAASWPFIFILVNWSKVPAMGDVGFTTWLGKALGTSVEGAPAIDLKRYIFLVAGTASLVLAVFSLALPHTPPKAARGDDSLAWLKATKLLRNPFVLVLFVVTFIDAAVHQSFFYWTFTFLGPKGDGGVVDIPANWVGPVMKIGQLAEILTMLFLGYVLKRFGWRTTMIVGVLGHAARFAVFAFYPEPWAAITVNVLHGICYAFFFATVYIFVDEYFPRDIRSSAQGLFNLLILGVGPFAANFCCGRLKDIFTPKGGNTDYSEVFRYSMGAALLGALILLLFFHPRKPAEDPGFNRAEEDAPTTP